MRRLNAVVRAKERLISYDRLAQLAIVNRGFAGGTGYADLQRVLKGDADQQKKQ